MSGGVQIPRRLPLDESIFAAISGRAGSSIVDIPTVLERVDSVERWLLTFEELDGGLQRLSDDGRIGEVDIGRFVSLGSPHATRPYSGLSVGRYDEAVTAYRMAFAADAVSVMRSPLLRGFTSLLRGAYRVTGGRIGLAPEWVDLDAVAITFAVERVLIPFGASTGDPAIKGDAVVVPIEEGARHLDRSVVVLQVQGILRESNIRRAVILRFSGGDEVLTTNVTSPPA